MNAPQLLSHVFRGVLCAGLALAAAAKAAEPGDTILDLRDMTYVASKGAVNEVVLEAAFARIEPGRDVANLERVKARLEPEAAARASGGSLDLICDRGTFDLASGDFLAQGNVNGTTGDGRHFLTTELRYQHDKGLVTTDEPVTIRDKAGRYRGGGFRYFVRENRFLLVGGAQVVQDK